MICQDCKHCRKITHGNGQYKVDCMFNGTFPIHEMNTERFNCPSDAFEQREEKKEPPKPNIMVILKTSGRDIAVYSEMIQSPKALLDWWDMIDKNRYFYINGFAFNPEDVSVVAYIGE